jgi:hypothetical protein
MLDCFAFERFTRRAQQCRRVAAFATELRGSKPYRELGSPLRRGRGRQEGGRFYVRFCFAHARAADAFRDRFGGERLTYTSEKPRPPTAKRRFEASLRAQDRRGANNDAVKISNGCTPCSSRLKQLGQAPPRRRACRRRAPTPLSTARGPHRAVARVSHRGAREASRC